ncbi:MAG: ribosome biogenesis/translation initiation ATPase RLI [Candidatus Jordarchaeales archaeon]
MVRVAVIDKSRCKPNDCSKECYRFCPGVRMRQETVTFDEETGKARIAESLCEGEGICVKKCPFKAIRIVNLPEELEEDLTFRYGPNSFKLYRLPIPKSGRVTGLIGPNGVGKTTAMRILSGEIKPNFGRFDNPPDWDEIIRYYRGSELQGYFEKMANGDLKVVHKPQNITLLPKVVKGVVADLLERADERGTMRELVKELELEAVLERELEVLSGGELQRVAIAAAVSREADVYLFDEPSSYLDIYQRLNAARVIRRLLDHGKTVICVEHDLALADYLSDVVCMFYAEPGVYGIVTHPHSVREGINIYLDGYLPDENLRFRSEAIRFHVNPVPAEKWVSEKVIVSFGEMEKRLDGFTLRVEGGAAHKGEVIGIIGPNGIGKTTFVKLIAGILKPDAGSMPPQTLKVSYKPQYLKATYDGTVQAFLQETEGKKVFSSDFKTAVLEPLEVTPLLDREIKNLSGGELQRVAIAACLAREADVYLIDEPSAFLSSEQRLNMARVVRRVIEKSEAAAFVVEHDIVLVDVISDSLMVFTGKPGVQGIAHRPVDLKTGMNRFLERMNITFRRDYRTGRPRVNKEGSRLDKMQKAKSMYYYIEERHDEGEESP